MLIEKSSPVNLFDLIPLERDKVLDELDQLLEEDALFQDVKRDLAQRHPRTLTRGRPSTPVEVILRMLVAKHLYNWSYEKTENFVSDSITLRQFCRVYLNPVWADTFTDIHFRPGHWVDEPSSQHSRRGWIESKEMDKQRVEFSGYYAEREGSTITFGYTHSYVFRYDFPSLVIQVKADGSIELDPNFANGKQKLMDNARKWESFLKWIGFPENLARHTLSISAGLFNRQW